MLPFSLTVVEVHFQQLDYTVYEDAGSVTVCVNSNGLRRRLRDFIVCIIDIIFGFKEIVVFPPTTCEVCVDINITNGTYLLPLQLDSSDPAVVFDVNSSSTVFVIDSFNVTFQQDMQTILESVGVLDVCVTVSDIDNPNFPGIDVALHTEDGSALGKCGSMWHAFTGHSIVFSPTIYGTLNNLYIYSISSFQVWYSS